MKQTHFTPEQIAAAKDNIKNNYDRIKEQKIIVVGDIGLDEYIWGEVDRVSPEAPVPVVDVTHEDIRIGLAGNVAQNIRSLGGEPVLIGVVGEDAGADSLKAELEKVGVSGDYLISEKDRPTTRKIRVISGNHHIVRVDYELKKFLKPETEQKLLAKIKTEIAGSSSLIIEDYAKGVLSESVIKEIISICHEAGKEVLVDPHLSTPPEHYQGADLLTPNLLEASELSKISFKKLDATEQTLFEVAESLIDIWKCKELVITRGKDGMSLFSGSKDSVTHMPTFAKQVFDVTGAGDTVIAALALARSAGFSLEESCVMGNLAAGTVVAKVGCVPCTEQDMMEILK